MWQGFNFNFSSLTLTHSVAKTVKVAMWTFNVSMVKPFLNLSHALQVTASKDKSGQGIAIVALVDTGFLPMTLNFFATSILKHGLENVLCISLSHKICEKLKDYNIPCYPTTNTSIGDADNKIGIKVFRKKMDFRADLVLKAMEEKVPILLTDIDMVYFKNPLPYFKCSKCDIEALIDEADKNLKAGFVLYRPTENSRKLAQNRITLGQKMKANDQTILNSAVRQMQHVLKVSKLNKTEFVCGLTYFSKGHRYFAGDYPSCKECVVIYNNWIVSQAAKIYRLKENHLWVNDNGGYYSDPNRKYITYSNPVNFSADDKTSAQENKSFENALAIARITNRTIILPKCQHKQFVECSLNFKFSVAVFDSVFKNMYREHTLIMNQKVAST